MREWLRQVGGGGAPEARLPGFGFRLSGFGGVPLEDPVWAVGHVAIEGIGEALGETDSFSAVGIARQVGLQRRAGDPFGLAEGAVDAPSHRFLVEGRKRIARDAAGLGDLSDELAWVSRVDIRRDTMA